MSIPVILVVYKNPRQQQQCLAALKRLTTPVLPWIHDNSENNLYYTKAANLGLRHAIRAGSRYAMTLTQDCYLAPNAVEQLVRFMEAHPRCAIAGIKQLLGSNPDYINHGGCLRAYPQGIHIVGFKSRGDCIVSKPMPWVNGTCMMIRLDAILDFGLMDENLLLYGNDSDWCFTARARNWEVWYCAEAEAIHEEGASRQIEESPLKEIYQHDMQYWRKKWIGSELYDQLSNEPSAKPRMSGQFRM